MGFQAPSALHEIEDLLEQDQFGIAITDYLTLSIYAPLTLAVSLPFERLALPIALLRQVAQLAPYGLLSLHPKSVIAYDFTILGPFAEQRFKRSTFQAL